MFINYSDLPGFRELYTDYLYNFDNVRPFYKQDFRNTDSYEDKFKEIAGSTKLHRKLLPDILKEQYGNEKISKPTEMNIALLGSEKTIAVVTGQQLSIFGGPLYTIYKTITAIKLSKQLNEKYVEYKFVPVFWLEGDDHDFDEVTSVNLLDKTNSFKTIKYDDGKEEGTNRGSIGKLEFNENFQSVLDEFIADLRDSDFKEEIAGYIKEFYKVSANFKTAFRLLLNKLFSEYGLVIFDPQDIKIKKLLRPVFQKEIENFQKHADFAIQRSAELEETYHAQVKVKPVNLFLKEGEGRYVVEPDNDGFKLKNKRIRFSKEEFLTKLENNPEDFSANVLLRPMCQDYILPTGFYIGGPSEIAYFAQVIPFYEYFNIPQPFVFPRASATILEKNILNLLEKYDLKITDILSDNDLKDSVLSKISEYNTEDGFKTAEEEIKLSMEKLKELINKIDPTLIDNANKSLDRIYQTLSQMKGKVDKAVERKNDTVLNQLDKLKINLYPNNNYQERVFNYTTYAIKYGNDLVKWIYDELSINKFEHQILEI